MKGRASVNFLTINRYFRYVIAKQSPDFMTIQFSIPNSSLLILNSFLLSHNEVYHSAAKHLIRLSVISFQISLFSFHFSATLPTLRTILTGSFSCRITSCVSNVQQLNSNIVCAIIHGNQLLSL